jgi:M6 family metalloprotease-like protein
MTQVISVINKILLPVVLVIGALHNVSAFAVNESDEMVNNIANFRFDQLGHPQIQSDSIKPVLASVDRPHKLLIIPVRFPQLGYDRFAGEADQNDQNNAYFQHLLFAGGVKESQQGTLTHYYQHQSRGLYNVSGDIFSVVELDKPLSHYGRPVQSADGTWRSDERSDDLVVETLHAAYAADPDFPWQDYDQWDPEDFDADGNRDEPDGYIDHFVMIVAGKGQNSCQGLYKLSEKLNTNATPETFDKLNDDERACADRIWPHRGSISQNLDSGPEVGGQTHVKGGIDIGNGLWVLDYNMQSEYTEVSTFIHEFGHSLGLPDVYARSTSNSTGSWTAMSSTLSPEPQELSTWSRMMLGWMKPCVVRPPANGGSNEGNLYLKTMNDWSASGTPDGLCDSAMVILPPKFRDIQLGPLESRHGKQAIYTGQGNDMLRTLSRTFDFSEVEAGTDLRMELDAWFVIEAEWDYLYVETATEGEPFKRILPDDKSSIEDKSSVMSSAKGHEGEGSTPGFTGRSGDLDGDGKVETTAACDPSKQRVLAEDRIDQEESDPCEQAQWISASFDLNAYRGKQVTVRFTYFTDGAAVEAGALLDNIRVAGVGFQDDFEGSEIGAWNANGFTLSGGSHHLAVPHFYILEYRDPYEAFAEAKNYDEGLTKPRFTFFPTSSGELQAFNVNYRPGVVMWYYNGEYLWSQNEPTQQGPGNGFLLVVDANPQEYQLPIAPQENYKTTEDGWTYWEFDGSSQPFLKNGFVDMMCFLRRPDYYSTDVSEEDRESCAAAMVDGSPPLESATWGDRKMTYGYTIINEWLPGEDRRSRKSAGAAYDLRIRDGESQYRLYDRALRNHHSADAPFALQGFDNGVEFYEIENGKVTLKEAKPFAPVSSFTDAEPNRYQNPKLPFGGAAIPHVEFSYQLVAPGESAPPGTKVAIKYQWAE